MAQSDQPPLWNGELPAMTNLVGLLVPRNRLRLLHSPQGRSQLHYDRCSWRTRLWVAQLHQPVFWFQVVTAMRAVQRGLMTVPHVEDPIIKLPFYPILEYESHPNFW